MQSSDAVLKECRQTEAGGGTELETIRRLEKRIQAIAREVQNLTAAIKMGGSIPELVGELNACREQRAVLERELVTANAKVAPQIDDEITAEHIEEALRDLQTTLKYADPEERKQVVQENVKEVRIPPEGDAELVSAPDGFARLFGVHSNGDPEGSRNERENESDPVSRGPEAVGEDSCLTTWLGTDARHDFGAFPLRYSWCPMP